MLRSFLKLNAKSSVAGGKDYKALVFVDHIGSVIEAVVGCQIVCTNGDLIPVKESLEDVEKMIKKALGGTGHTLAV